MILSPLPVPLATGEPDSASTPATGPTVFADPANAFADALTDASRALERADRSERGFAHGIASLQTMVIERAHADIALAIASAAASRTTQSLSTILGMQV